MWVSVSWDKFIVSGVSVQWITPRLIVGSITDVEYM